jgi:hypothetical protein
MITLSPPCRGAESLAEEEQITGRCNRQSSKEIFIMNKSLHLFGAAMAVVVAGTPALSMAAEPAAKGSAVVLSDSVHAKATIVNIDKKERKLTLRSEKGEEFNLIAGEEVRNFNQIKKGDIVEVEYHVAVASRLE